MNNAVVNEKYRLVSQVYIYHILLDYNPNTSVSKIVKQLKQYTTYHMWEKYEKQLSKIYWKKRVLWSDVYFACSIWQVSQDVIEKYILTQG